MAWELTYDISEATISLEVDAATLPWLYKQCLITATVDALQRVWFGSFVLMMSDCRVLLSCFVHLVRISKLIISVL